MSGDEEEPGREGRLTHQRPLWPFKVSLCLSAQLESQT